MATFPQSIAGRARPAPVAPLSRSTSRQCALDLDPDAENFVNNAIYLTGTPPPDVKVEVKCKDFSDAATVTLALAPHKSPVPGNAWRFPYPAGELRSDEYYQTDAVHWANGGARGTQIFAHDIGVVGWDNVAKKWSALLPGTNGSQNDDYRIWNKPVRAVADGTVETWFDGMDDNTVLGEFPDPTPSPTGGNNILVNHGTERVKYCHFRKGSMPAELKIKGAKWWISPDLTTFQKTAQDLFEQKGLRLTHVMTWSEGGARKWFGIARSGNWASRWWISPGLGHFRTRSQQLFDDEDKRLVHVTTYQEGSARRWIGISQSGTWANRWIYRSDLDSFALEAQSLFDDEHLRLVHVDVLE